MPANPQGGVKPAVQAPVAPAVKADGHGHSHEALAGDLKLAGIDVNNENLHDQVSATTALLMKKAGIEDGKPFDADAAAKVKSYLGTMEPTEDWKKNALKNYVTGGRDMIPDSQVAGVVTESLNKAGLTQFVGHEKGMANLIVNRNQIVDNILAYNSAHPLDLNTKDKKPELQIAAAAPAAPEEDQGMMTNMLLGMLGVPREVMDNPSMMGMMTEVMKTILEWIDPIVQQMSNGKYSLSEMFNVSAEPKPDVEVAVKAEAGADKKVAMDLKTPAVGAVFNSVAPVGYQLAQTAHALLDSEAGAKMVDLGTKTSEDLKKLWDENKEALKTPEEVLLAQDITPPAAKASFASLG